MTKQAAHFLPELVGFVLCSHCLKLARKHSEEAEEACSELKETLKVPEAIEALKEMKASMPKGLELFQELVRESEPFHTSRDSYDGLGNSKP